MNRFLSRVVVVLKAAPTWLVALAAAVQVVADELAGVLPSDNAATVTAVALRVGAYLAAVVAIIRRVTPVLESERGLLPEGK